MRRVVVACVTDVKTTLFVQHHVRWGLHPRSWLRKILGFLELRGVDVGKPMTNAFVFVDPRGGTMHVSAVS